MAKGKGKDCFVGIDLGTSSVKAVAADGDGEVLASARRDLELIAQSPLQAEQDAELWWTAAQAAVRDVVDALPDPRRIQAVGLTGQKHALLPLDPQDDPVRPAFIWADGRARSEVDEMKLVFPAMRRRTGIDALPGLIVPKWLRFLRTEPELARETARICYAKDFLRLRLTGTFATDRSEASASQLFDFRSNTWSETLTTIFEVNAGTLPPVFRCIEPAGEVHADAAMATGIPVGTPVVAGAGDNEAAAVAAGALGDGRVGVILGTSGTVIGWSRLRTPAGGLVWNRHATTGGYAATGTVLSAGRAIDWARHAFFPPGTRMVEVLKEAEAVDPRVAPLVFLPALVGERSPVPDPHATGAFVGLRPMHRRGHLARAVLEGVSVAIAEVLMLMRGAGVEVRELRLTSGGSASAFWRRTIGAAAGLPVRQVAHRHGPALGAAALAAAMTGQHGNLRAISERWSSPGPQEAADMDEHRRLQRLATATRSVRNALRGVSVDTERQRA